MAIAGKERDSDESDGPATSSQNRAWPSSLNDAENVTADRSRFPTLKDTLVVRMAEAAAPPGLPEHPIVPPKLPTIVAGVRLEAQRTRAPGDSEARSRSGGRNASHAGVIAGIGAAFLAGALAAYAVFSAHLFQKASKLTPVAAAQAPVWPDLLATGSVSPRGQNSDGVAADQAFQIADAKLHGIGAPPDFDEARYWLRVGIARSLSGDRLRWALTQLGTLYARPTAAAADFAVARSVWEIAAAQGDPVALCFLARLEEGGPSTQQNRAVALKLFEQAKAAGNCSGSEQAIERLSR